jgi:sensor histidine kinase YesM
VRDARAQRALLLRQWLLVVGAGLVVSALASVSFYVNAVGADDKGMTWAIAIFMQTSHWMLWAAFYPVFFVLVRRVPLERARRFRSLATYVLATPVLVFAHASIYLALISRTYPYLKMDPLASWLDFVWALFTLDFVYRVLGYAFLLSFAHALDYHERYKDKESQLARAQLDALKMQLQPHFLFNTLNAISALLHRDPEAADRMIARLGDFLRMTLENDGGHEVALSQEMMFLKCYLSIEEVRFGDRLTTRFDVDQGALSALVPNLILQPIVENAIRHGVGRIVGEGRIEIAATRTGGRLRLDVKDNGPGCGERAEGEIPSGVGLLNTRRRLQQLYGDRCGLQVTNPHEGGCRVTIEVPFRTVAEEAGA